MDELLTVKVPKKVVDRLAAAAAFGNRPLEDVAGEYLGQVTDERPFEWMPDEAVLAVANGRMPLAESQQLYDLQADQREGRLSEDGRRRMNELMQLYGAGQIRKAEAMVEAIRRGLMSRGQNGRS